MSEPFLAEIKIVGFNFPPRGWALCDGQILPIDQHQALFSLLGTTYGGDGRTTFALPDLRGRTPIHPGEDQGITYNLGHQGGAAEVVLATGEMPAHNHTARASASNGNQPVSAGGVLAAANNLYADPAELLSVGNPGLAPAGNKQAHSNMQPYTVLYFVIALQGLFPSRN